MQIDHQFFAEMSGDQSSRDFPVSKAARRPSEEGIANPQDKQYIKGKCDICEKKDGFKGLNLQRCKKCGLTVHELCYSMVSTKGKNPDWLCHACRATPEGKTRPTECVLCFVNDGIHAMHPLYDKDGPNGKPVILPADTIRMKPRREAWVHSLCAVFISGNSLTKGVVYGCDENGDYDGDDIDEDSDADGDDDEEQEMEFEADEAEEENSNISSTSEESDSPVIRKHKTNKNEKQEINTETNDAMKSSNDARKKEEDKDNELELMSIHHFVLCGKNKDGSHTPWSQRIEDSRQLKCFVCGQKDTRKGCLRIPVQCAAGGDEEFKEFKDRHLELNETCFVAMHVGCARWKGNPVHQRVYFFPGTQVNSGDEMFAEPVCCCYCNAHAKDIKENKPRKPREKPVSTSRVQLNRLKNTNVTLDPQKMRQKLAKGKNKNQGRAFGKASNSKTRPLKRKGSTKSDGNTQAIKKTKLQMASKQNGVAKSTLIPDAQAQNISSIDLWYQEMKDDIQKKFVANGDDVIDVIREAKGFWRHKTQLPIDDFKTLWKRVLSSIQSIPQSKEDFPAQETKDEQTSTISESVLDVEGPLHASENQRNRGSQERINRWEGLWMPKYGGKLFIIDNWDIMQQIQP